MQTPPPTTPSSSTAAAEVDAAIWRAVAGATVCVPAVNAYVYYFPQGHLEHCSAADAGNNYNFTLMRPWIPCKVISVRLLSNPDSDQVLAKMLLQPLRVLGLRQPLLGRDEVHDNDDVVKFAKTLTLSDANNGGGFSLPRFCADMILPQLDLAANPPVQNLVLRDTHGNAWKFRHIYRGKPLRHLLTTGWSKFVNAKRLVAGDSVLFMKKRSTGELFVGIRRAERFGGAAEAVAAIERAVGWLPFEVVYYPKVGCPDFVVMVEKVNDALRRQWSAGMVVRTTVETEDASRMSFIQGVVSAASTPIAGIWCGSPWRMLQVNWNVPESSNNVKNVNPWEVEIVPISPLINPEIHSSKKLKFSHDSGYLPTQKKRPYSTTSSSSIFDFSQYPPAAGMQGPRRDHIPAAAHLQPPPPINAQLQPAIAAVQNLQPSAHNLQPVAHNLQPAQELISMSRVQSIGSSNSDIVSPASQGSVQSTSGQSSTSFQLFGTTIQMPGGGGGGDGDESCACGGDGCDRCI